MMRKRGGHGSRGLVWSLWRGGVLIPLATLAVALPAVAQDSSPLDLFPTPTPAPANEADPTLPSSPPPVEPPEPSTEAVARSQAQFDDLGRDAALKIARLAFPELVSAPVFDAARPADDVRVEEFLGDGMAMVHEKGTPEPLIMDSTVPLRVRDGVGRDPVDLSLEASAGDDFAPEDALVPVELDGQKPAGELLEGGARLVVDGTAEREMELVGDRTFQPNSFTDTDAFVVPNTSGFEINLIIRSPESPERFWIDLRGVPGARFVELKASLDEPHLQPDGFMIQGADGGVLGYVRDPLAYDADRRAVESRLEIDGDRLRMTVEHRDEPIVYPVAADPVAEQSYGLTGSGTKTPAGWQGWEHKQASRAGRTCSPSASPTASSLATASTISWATAAST